MKLGWVLYPITVVCSCQAADIGTHDFGVHFLWTGSSDAGAVPDGSAAPLQPNTAGSAADAQPVKSDTTCAPPHPTAIRLLQPQSGSVVTSDRPRFAWTGTTGPYDLQVCSDRACNTVLLQAGATSNETTIAQAIPPGYWFWRVRAASASCPTWTSSWEMRVRRRFSGYQPAANSSVPGFSDYNGDGYPDVAVLGSAPLIYLGGHDGLAPDRVLPAVPAAATSMALIEPQSDVNGDGFTDVSSTGLITIPGQSQQGYGAHVQFGAPGGLSSSGAFIQTPSGAGMPTGIGDFNGDGFGDLTVEWRYGGDLLLGSVSTTPWAGLHCDDCQLQQIATGDFNGDGLNDLVFADGSAISLYMGDPHQATWHTIEGISGLSVVDFNYDGFSDLVFPTLSGSSEAYEGGPNGISTTPSTSFPPLAFSLVGDFDGDGYWDYVSATGPQLDPTDPPPTAVMYGAPGGCGAPPMRRTTLDRAATTSTALVVDVNADGYDDLVVQEPGQTVMYWYAGSPSGLASTPTRTLAH